MFRAHHVSYPTNEQTNQKRKDPTEIVMQYPPVKNHSDRYFKTCIMCMWETMGNLQIYVVPGSTGTKSSVWKCGKFHGENPRKIMKKVGQSKSSEFLPWHHATSWCQPLLHTRTYTSKCTYLKLALLQSPGGIFSRCYCYTFDNIAWSYPCDTLVGHGRTIPSTVFVFPGIGITPWPTKVATTAIFPGDIMHESSNLDLLIDGSGALQYWMTKDLGSILGFKCWPIPSHTRICLILQASKNFFQECPAESSSGSDGNAWPHLYSQSLSAEACATC